jgi:hypothetical protein
MISSPVPEIEGQWKTLSVRITTSLRLDPLVRALCGTFSAARVDFCL